MTEQIYDEQIAPLMMQAAKICEAAGVALVATVEYAPGEFGSTAILPDGAATRLRLAAGYLLSGNVDTLIIELMKQARKTGHSSMILSQLGVPLRADER